MNVTHFIKKKKSQVQDKKENSCILILTGWVIL